MLNTFKEIISSITINDLHAWIGRFIIWSAAALAGLAIVLFARATEHAIAWFYGMQAAVWWLPILIMPTVGIFIVWVTRTWLAGAAGSDIPQTMAALQKHIVITC